MRRAVLRPVLRTYADLLTDVELPEAEWVFAFPLPPNMNASGWGHWRAQHAAHEKWRRKVDLLAAHPFFPRPPASPFASVWITATLVMPAPMDHDNALRRASKWPIDYLVRHHYLANDAPKNLSWRALPGQRITRSLIPRVLLTIEPRHA